MNISISCHSQNNAFILLRIQLFVGLDLARVSKKMVIFLALEMHENVMDHECFLPFINAEDFALSLEC